MDAITAGSALSRSERLSGRQTVLANLPTVAIAGAGFIAYTGNSYIASRFSAFGLDSGLLVLSQGYIIPKGVVAAVGGSILTLWEHRWTTAYSCAVAIVLWLSLLAARKYLPSLPIWRPLDAAKAVYDRHHKSLARLAVLTALALTASIAGPVGADYDTDHIRDAVKNGRGNVYATSTESICGIPLGQDAITSVFVTRSGVRFLRTQELKSMRFVGKCP